MKATGKLLTTMTIALLLGSSGAMAADYTGSRSAVAPGTASIEDVAVLGFTFCERVTEDFGGSPFFCGTGGGFGAFYDDINVTAAQGQTHADGSITLSRTPGATFNGRVFFSFCSDRDDDDSCTNIDPVNEDTDGYDDDFVDGTLPYNQGSVSEDFCFREDVNSADIVNTGGGGWDDWTLFAGFEVDSDWDPQEEFYQGTVTGSVSADFGLNCGGDDASGHTHA